MKESKVVFEFVEKDICIRFTYHICGGYAEKTNVRCEFHEGQFKGCRIFESDYEYSLEIRDFDVTIASHFKELEEYATNVFSSIARIDAQVDENWEKVKKMVEDRMLCTDTGHS